MDDQFHDFFQRKCVNVHRLLSNLNAFGIIDDDVSPVQLAIDAIDVLASSVMMVLKPEYHC